MNAPALHIGEKHCARCDRWKTVDSFPGGSNRYCYPCKRAYESERAAAIKAGTWRPRNGEKLRRPRRVAVTVPPVDEEQLFAVMTAFFGRYGFGALTTTTERLRTKISRRNRTALAREGWIA